MTTSLFALVMLGSPLTVWVDDDYDASTPGWQVDRFDRVQDGVAAVATGGTVNVLAGTYAEAVVVDRAMTLTGQGPGAPAIDAGGAGPTVTVTGNGATVSALVLRNVGLSSDPAVRVEADDVTVSDNTIGPASRGVWIESGADGNRLLGNTIVGTVTGVLVYSEGNTIQGNTLSGNYTHDMLVGGRLNTVAGNVVGSSCYHGVDVNGVDNTIVGNTLFGHTKNLEVRHSERTQVRDNTIPQQQGTYNSVELYQSPDTLLEDNTIGQAQFAAVDAQSCDRLVVRGNSFVSDAAPALLYVTYSSEATIESNSFESGGIAFDGSLPEHFRTHTIASNTTGGRPIRYYRDVVGPFDVPQDTAQLLLASCTGVRAAGLFLNETASGVLLAYSDGNTVEDCFAVACSTGVDIVESHGNAITRNHVTASAFRGVGIRSSGGNTLSENTFVDNTVPLSSHDCDGLLNTFVRNSFVEGGLPSDGCGGTWSAPLPTGGNYYEQYGGSDADGDGIGDVPQPTGSMQDDLPWMRPTPRGVLWSESTTISASESTDYLMYLEAGAPSGGRPFLTLAGMTGWAPGTQIPNGPLLPLNLDPVTYYVLMWTNTSWFQHFAKNLNASGGSYSWVKIGPLGPAFVGFELTFAYALTDTLDYVSEPLRALVVP